MLDGTSFVHVLRIHGLASGHAAELCSAMSGRRELTTNECGALAEGGAAGLSDAAPKTISDVEALVGSAL